jgi:antitoxin CptB
MMSETSANSVSDERMRRLRWRSRRGLLENDLLLEKFFERHGRALTESQVAGLDRLLDLPDNELLDLVLGRKGGGEDPRDSETLAVLELLRRC